MVLLMKRILVTAMAAAMLCPMLCACSGAPAVSSEPHKRPSLLAGEQNAEYTWEELESMTPEEQIAFQNSFSSAEAFDAWLEQAQAATPQMPWETGGKAPIDYTWEEFEALSAQEQIAFQNSFDDLTAFNDWLVKAQSSVVELPWNDGGKQPEDYTWEEFEALSPEQQLAFQNSFEDVEAFDAWMQEASFEEVPEFSESEGKRLDDYTWEEFENMTAEEQIRFQNSFDSFEAFDQWLQKTQREAGIIP